MHLKCHCQFCHLVVHFIMSNNVMAWLSVLPLFKKHSSVITSCFALILISSNLGKNKYFLTKDLVQLARR